MKSFCLIAGIVLICAWPASHAAQNVEESAPFASGGRLEVSIVSGSVKVRGWNRETIQVSGRLSSDDDRLRFDVADSDAFVTVYEERERRGNRHKRKQDGDAHLVINVPAATRVAVHTVSGDIEVGDTTGLQRLESVSGDIKSQLRAREGTFRTVSGEIDIDADETLERLAVHSVSGDADINGAGGELRLETVSGDFDVVANRFSRLQVTTVNGDFEIEGELIKGGDVSIESVNGDIRLATRSLYDTEFDLESFNGSISRIFDYKPVRQSRYAPGYLLRLTEGDGASRIRVETLNGDIDITGAESGRTPRISNATSRAVQGGRDDDDHDHDHAYDHVHDFHDDDFHSRGDADSDRPRRFRDSGGTRPTRETRGTTRRDEIEDFDAAMKALEQEMRELNNAAVPPAPDKP